MISDFDTFFASKGWNVLEVGVPKALDWQSYAIWNPETGIRMYTTAPTKIEAAAKMVSRFTGLTPEPKSGTMEALRAALVGLTHQIADDL